MGIWDDADDVYLCSKQKKSAGRGIFFSMIRCTSTYYWLFFYLVPKQRSEETIVVVSIPLQEG